MAYAIQSFQCTDLGLEQLQLAKSNTLSNKAVSLSAEETQCLLLIQEYRNPDVNPYRLQEIELEFQSLYEAVNLTRLVVIKLLTFNDTPIPHPNSLKDSSKKQSSSPSKDDKDTQLSSEESEETIDPTLVVVSGIFSQ